MGSNIQKYPEWDVFALILVTNESIYGETFACEYTCSKQ